jgi:DNA-binding CsgD family transcriptional regulator
MVSVMARTNTGSLHSRTLADGTRVFRLRFNVGGQRQIMTLHERIGCDCGCGGGWDERAARRWLEAKTEGVFGELRASTVADYRCCIERHLLPVFGDCWWRRSTGRGVCGSRLVWWAMRASYVKRSTPGRSLRDERGRRRVPLGPASICKMLLTLAAILEDAVEDELIETNPARGKRMRVRVPKPERTFLEMDELALLLDAAGAQDLPRQDGAPEQALGPRSRQVARLLGKGYRPLQIAKRLGVAPGTVAFICAVSASVSVVAIAVGV